MKPIPVNEPLLNGNEKKYLIECIDSGWISSEGHFVKEFEEKFSARMGRKYGITVCNGSAALDIAIATLGIGPGDEVIIPTFTIISCAAAIVRAGASFVVVDSDPLTWNMDVTQIEDKITSKTKAIMVVHIYGLPVDLYPVLDLASKYGLQVIEDAAEAHGLDYENQPCGSFGTISTFSFYSNKHVTCGEGGMVLVDDEQLAERCRLLRNLFFQPQQRFVHEEIGWNMRMSNLQAAIGVAQLEQLKQVIVRKRKIGKLYTEFLSDVECIQLPLSKTPYADNIYWVFGVVLKNETPFDAQQAMKSLAKYNIGTRPFFWPIHEQPVFKKMCLCENVSCPVAEKIARRGFYLPTSPMLTEEQIKYIVFSLKEILM